MRKGLCADLSSADFIPAWPDNVRRGSHWYLERRLTVAQRWPPKSPSDPYSSWQLESCPPSGEHTPQARPPFLHHLRRSSSWVPFFPGWELQGLALPPALLPPRALCACGFIGKPLHSGSQVNYTLSRKPFLPLRIGHFLCLTASETWVPFLQNAHSRRADIHNCCYPIQ